MQIKLLVTKLSVPAMDYSWKDAACSINICILSLIVKNNFQHLPGWPWLPSSLITRKLDMDNFDDSWASDEFTQAMLIAPRCSRLCNINFINRLCIWIKKGRTWWFCLISFSDCMTRPNEYLVTALRQISTEPASQISAV